MEHRHLGRSGLKVSEIAYGNWITHGSQVEDDAATACVHAALDLGVTTFDTADVYAGTKAEVVAPKALTPEEQRKRSEEQAAARNQAAADQAAAAESDATELA